MTILLLAISVAIFASAFAYLATSVGTPEVELFKIKVRIELLTTATTWLLALLLARHGFYTIWIARWASLTLIGIGAGSALYLMIEWAQVLGVRSRPVNDTTRRER